MSGDKQKKKHGERKDKKDQRMRENVAERKDHAGNPSPTTDQPDIQSHKPGSANDFNRRP